MILTSSMAWTQADADQVRAAILAIATGTRVVQVSYAGPPARAVTYQAADLPELRRMLAEIEHSASTKPGYRLATTRKGL